MRRIETDATMGTLMNGSVNGTVSRAPQTRSTCWRLLGSLGLACAWLVGCGGPDKPAASPEASEDAPPAPVGTESGPASVHADPPAPSGAWPFGPAPTEAERRAQLDRLQRDPGPLKSNWVPPGKGERYGHAEGLVAAPVAVVKAKLEDFMHYKELAGPKFKTVRVVDKQGDATDVYFQLPIMKGLLTINYVTRFPKAKPAPGGFGDVVEGTFVKGNIKSMHIAFTVRPGNDPGTSVMMCDLLLLPSIPAPQSAVDEELRDACGDAINAVRKTTAALAPPSG